MEILLDGNLIVNKELLYKNLKEQINSPEFYGNNLDALWDILSLYKGNLVVIIKNKQALINNLGEYSTALLNLFIDLKVTFKTL